MTTIAYKDGIIAYDSRLTMGTDIKTDKWDKHLQVEGYHFFMSGNLGDDAIIAHMALTGEGDRIDGVEAAGLMVTPDRELWIIGRGQGEAMWQARWDVRLPTAFGSGTPFAEAAMDVGRTAKEAVKYAMTRDACTGGRIRTFKLPV